ncbi:MAG: hypothetical protein R6U50_02380 [Desulfobacterales bacterium]
MVIKQIKERFATLAMKRGFVDLSQVIEALTIQIKEKNAEKKHRPIGRIFRDLGYMNEKQVNDVLEAFIEPRFGDIAISKGFITPDQLIKGMIIQIREELEKKKRRPIGEILIDIGYMSTLQVEETLILLKREKFR